MEPSRLIDIAIVGAQKAGTSSLAYYLTQHPQIVTHKQLEMTFFVNDAEFRAGYSRAYRRHFPRNISPDQKLLAKSVGILYREDAMDRLAEHNKACKLIVVFRNPVDRAYSAYLYALRMGWETLPTFEQAIAAEEDRKATGGRLAVHCAYLERGHYAQQLANIRKRFPSSQTHILLMDDLDQELAQTMCTTLQFLGLGAEFLPIGNEKQNTARMARWPMLSRIIVKDHPLRRRIREFVPDGIALRLRNLLLSANQADGNIPAMDAETRNALVEHFMPLNRQLEELIGRNLSHWDQ